MKTKGFILWSPDLQRIEHVYKTKEAAKKAILRRTFDLHYSARLQGKELNRDSLSEFFGEIAQEAERAPWEVREVTVILEEEQKETNNG